MNKIHAIIASLKRIILFSCLFFFQVYAQSPSINSANHIKTNLRTGPNQEKQYELAAYKSYPIKNTGLFLGFGINARLLSDPRPILLPGTRTLRNQVNRDYLKGYDLRIWTAGFNGIISYRLFKKAFITIHPEFTSISAGKVLSFDYSNDSSPNIFLIEQEAKPSPSGFIHPLLKIQGTLQVSCDLTFQVFKNCYAGLQYSRTRYEYTTYQLLRNRNDRFMKGLNLIGICIEVGFPD